MPSQNLIRIIVSGSSSSKLLSKLILIRITLRLPSSLQQKVTPLESPSKRGKPSSAYKGI